MRRRRGVGEYRRKLAASAADWCTIRDGERAYLAFDGVMASPQVKVNGRDVGGWDYGYMSFTDCDEERVRGIVVDEGLRNGNASGPVGEAGRFGIIGCEGAMSMKDKI